MPGSNCEAGGQICDDLGSNIYYSAGPVLTLNGRITASDYVDILGNQVHPVAQVLYPTNDVIFQDSDSPKHTARSVQSWFKEHEDALETPSVAGIIAQPNTLMLELNPSMQHCLTRFFYWGFCFFNHAFR